MGSETPSVSIWGHWHSKSITAGRLAKILKVFGADVKVSPNDKGNLDILKAKKSGDYERVGFIDIAAEKVVRFNR